MLFRKKHPKSCSYCAKGTKLNDSFVLCVKRGIVPIEHACFHFLYDPCKRVPPRAKAPNFENYREEDFFL